MPTRTRTAALWRRVLNRLEKEYGRPERGVQRRPLDQLILGLLSAGTSERKAAQALRRLQTDFVDFNEVRVSRPNDVAEAIQVVADPEGKANRIIRVLQQLFLRYGGVDLDLLLKAPLGEAQASLQQLPGVDARTAATVVLLSLGGQALPADPAVVRLSKRIGLVDRAWSTDQVQEALSALVPSEERYAFYCLMQVHGEKVCLVKTTRCAACVLSRLCAGRRVRPAAARPAAHRGDKE